jgi:hypothetical protein
MDKMQHVNVGDTERFVLCFSMFLWCPDLCTHWTCMNQLLHFSGVSFLYVLFLCRFYVTCATWPRQVPCQCICTFNMTGGQALGSCVQSNHEVWLHGCTWWCADMQRA